MKPDLSNINLLNEYERQEKLKDYEEYIKLHKFYIIASLITLFMLGIFLWASLAHATDYTNEAYVNAIYKAEGGRNAEYPYGIRSIKCTGEECRRICFNTVKNNRQRYKEYGFKQYPNFIDFLGSRYCPVKAENDPKGLNKNWKKNVLYFLEKG